MVWLVSGFMNVKRRTWHLLFLRFIHTAGSCKGTPWGGGIVCEEGFPICAALPSHTHTRIFRRLGRTNSLDGDDGDDGRGVLRLHRGAWRGSPRAPPTTGNHKNPFGTQSTAPYIHLYPLYPILQTLNPKSHTPYTLNLQPETPTLYLP
jgi:hypothetical protein